MAFERYMRWRLKDLVHPQYPVLLEYAIRPEPRYGEGKPPHAEIAAILARSDEAYLAKLTELSAFSAKLTQISETANAHSPGEPYWQNDYFTALDAIILYGLIASRKPMRYLEVGSGNSTKFARRAVRDFDLQTELISIDPAPRAEVDRLCDRVIRQPLEDVDLVLFDELQAGDMLFIDNSHRVFQNSDVTVFFLEVLPRLKPGIIVHIHDIFLPFDYPRVWANRHYSEQYMLATYLLAGYDRFEVLLPLAHISAHPVMALFINTIWDQPVFQRAFDRNRKLSGGYIGTSFWLDCK